MQLLSKAFLDASILCRPPTSTTISPPHWLSLHIFLLSSLLFVFFVVFPSVFPFVFPFVFLFGFLFVFPFVFLSFLLLLSISSFISLYIF